MSAIDDLPPLREVIRRYDLSAKKSLGQNFLLDFNLILRIARSAGPLDGIDVVEIGPGNVLTGLIKRIDPSVELINVSDVASIEKFLG